MTAIILPRQRSLWKPPPGVRPESGHPHTQGMLGWWLMNDAGSVLRDVLGFRHASSVTNPGYRKAGKFGGACLSGNGVSDSCSASVPNSVFPDSLLTSGPISISYWYRRSGSTHSGVFGKGGNPTPNPLMVIHWSAQTPSLTRGHATDSRRWDASLTIVEGVWTHVAIVYTDNLVETDPRIYVNGRLSGFGYTSGTATGPVTGNNSAFMLGSNAYAGNNGNAVDDVRLYARALSPDEIDELIHNPFAAFPRRQVLYFTTASADPRYARPTSDISAGDWLPSTGDDLYAMVDETSYSDTDYISTTSESTCELGLNAVTDPATSSGQVLRYRAKSDYGNTLVATLKQGTTTIATRTHTSVPATWTDYTMTLSGAECDAITDYAALRVTLEAQQ